MCVYCCCAQGDEPAPEDEEDYEADEAEDEESSDEGESGDEVSCVMPGVAHLQQQQQQHGHAWQLAT